MSDRCPDCGSELEDFVEGSSMGQRCPSFGWSLVTTFTPPILDDEREAGTGSCSMMPSWDSSIKHGVKMGAEAKELLH